MTNEQRKMIYGTAINMGIYEKGNKDDSLHAVVQNVTGKSSLSQLTDLEAEHVIAALYTYTGTPKVVKAKNESTKNFRTGMVTPEQSKKVWYLMYELVKYDKTPLGISLGARLCKIIEKNIKVTAIERDPFRFLTFQNGNILIEVLKKMVDYELCRQIRI